MARRSFGAVYRQTAALTKKNLIIAVVRRPISTCFRALILPIAFLTLILEIKNLLSDNSRYGVGSPSPVPALNGGLLGDKPLVIVVPPGLGPDVNATVQEIVKPLADVFQQLIYLDNVTHLLTTCRVNIHGTSNCFAAIVFNDSPQTTGGSKTWSYTLRGDPGDGGYPFNVYQQSNIEDTKWLPLQVAIENAITNSTVIPNTYMFTHSTQEEQEVLQRQHYQELVITTYSIALFIATLSAIYHVVSMVTTERESGMAALIDTMGGSAVTRVLSYVIAFDLIYLPCWFISGFCELPITDTTVLSASPNILDKCTGTFCSQRPAPLSLCSGTSLTAGPSPVRASLPQPSSGSLSCRAPTSSSVFFS